MPTPTPSLTTASRTTRPSTPAGRSRPAMPPGYKAIVMAGRNAQKKTGRPRVLPTLALIFCLAGVTRFATGVGTAVAEGAFESRPTQLAALAEAPATQPARRPPAGVATDPAESAEMLLSITQRERALQAREDALAEREQILSSAEERITRQIAALQDAERQLAATMALAERASEEDINRLVTVFEAMRAEEAAQVFAEMDPSFAAGFIGRLQPASAAAIMAGLPPRQAYTLSTIVAGRNALAPRN